MACPQTKSVACTETRVGRFGSERVAQGLLEWLVAISKNYLLRFLRAPSPRFLRARTTRFGLQRSDTACSVYKMEFSNLSPQKRAFPITASMPFTVITPAECGQPVGTA